jgi:cobalt/nickel transport system ATP-binding protein
MSHHIVDFKNVSFRFPDGTEALRGINFRITHGESVGVVGANGAGKSTLLHHMNGYLMPTAGTVTIGDLILTAKTRREIRKKSESSFKIPMTSYLCRPFLMMSHSVPSISGWMKHQCGRGYTRP